jgi:hypothetical protein
MFGETEYDPSRQYTSVPMEEQIEALGSAVDAGKVCHSFFLFLVNFSALTGTLWQQTYKLVVLDQVH